ncbi:VanW family protein [Desulforamulus profundi]|uniref:VanW family protein n=1 Tax=Desulforamulus profundi TaxID=1383067 RepID=UPI001EE5D145|nr:VanW family protein [Desulforamulus profundi]
MPPLKWLPIKPRYTTRFPEKDLISDWLPGKIFSQNNTIGPYTSYKGYQTGPTYAGCNVTRTVGGGVCKIASLLYNVATLSDLKVIMRSPHSMTVPYVSPGQDATVFYGVKDFRFINDTEGPVVI